MSIIINRNMLLRSTYTLGLKPSNRPMSLHARPRNVPRIKAASAQLGLQIHNRPIRPLHSSLRTHQQQQNPPHPPNSTFPNLPLPPTDEEMNALIPPFSTLSVDGKLAQIASLQAQLATEAQKNDPTWKPGAYDALREGLARKEKEIRDADHWYWQMLRSISWGPTILLNVIIALFWS